MPRRPETEDRHGRRQSPAAPAAHRIGRALLVASAAFCALSVLRTATGVGGAGLAQGIYIAGILCAELAWCARFFVPDPARWAFACGIVGTAVWTAGELVTVVAGNGPGLSVADVVLFPVNPLMVLGIVLYGASAVPRPIAPARAVDALLSALTVAAVGASFVVQSAAAAVESQVATATVYPTGTVALIAAAIALLALRGWTFDRRFTLLLLGATTLATTEIAYRWAQSHGGVPVFGTFYDVGWMLGGLLIGCAAWNDQRPLRNAPHRAEIVVPVLLGAIALAVLITEGAREDSSIPALTLSGLAVATLLGRMALSLATNHRLLRVSHRDAITDEITGLGNNRSLVADVERLGGTEATLVLLDLNGFKAYNDTFGHPAGDDLLRRVGAALHVTGGPGSRAYRIGGDEFCVLLLAGCPTTPAALAAATCGLGSEHVPISAAFGTCQVPSEARTPAAAIRLADERMYADKRAGRDATAPA